MKLIAATFEFSDNEKDYWKVVLSFDNGIDVYRNGKGISHFNNKGDKALSTSRANEND